MSALYTCEKCTGNSYEQFSQTQVRCLNCGCVSELDTGYRVIPQFEKTEIAAVSELDKKPVYINASFGKRITNYLIDIIFISIFIYFIGNIFQLEIYNSKGELTDMGMVLLVVIIPVYYLLMEYSFGKTLGKMVTRTKVISMNGNKLTFFQCAIRALTRLLPLEQFSGLFFNGIFWHDSIPKTLVVED